MVRPSIDGIRSELYKNHVQERGGMTVTTYSDARARLTSLCDLVSSSREPVIIKRRSTEDVAQVSAAELSSLMETAHLLRSPRNAQRLLQALQRSLSKDVPPMSLESLREKTGLAEG